MVADGEAVQRRPDRGECGVREGGRGVILDRGDLDLGRERIGAPGQVVAHVARQCVRLPIHPRGRHLLAECDEHLLAGEGDAVGQLDRRSDVLLDGRFDDRLLREVVRVCVAQDGRKLAGGCLGLGIAEFDAQLEPVGAADEVPRELVCRAVDLVGEPLGRHHAREDPQQAVGSAFLAAAQERRPPGVGAVGREGFVHPLAELWLELVAQEPLVCAGLPEQGRQLADGRIDVPREVECGP